MDETLRRSAESAVLACFELCSGHHGTPRCADAALMVAHGVLADYSPSDPVYNADSVRRAVASAAAVHVPTKLRVRAFRETTTDCVAGWAAFQALREVHFHRSSLTNAAVAELSRLRHLESLSLTRITTVNDVTPLRHHPTLRRLDLRFTGVCEHGPSFDAIASLPELEWLDLGSMQFARHTLVRLSSGCPKLRSLALDGSNVGNNAVRWLSDIESLEFLDLRECGLISDASPLANLRLLRELRLANNFSLTSQPTMAALGTLPQLEYLDVSVCTQLTDLAGLGRCRALQRLNLRGTKLNDDALDEFLPLAMSSPAAAPANASGAAAVPAPVGLRTIYVTQCPNFAARRVELQAALTPIELRFGSAAA